MAADERHGGHAGSGSNPHRSKSRWVVPTIVVGVLGAIGFLATQTPPASEPDAATATAETALAAPVLKAPSGREVFVAANGLATNPGTRQEPVDLATALSSNSPASPGDTIWLRGGTYLGNFTSVLAGTEAMPIHVRQALGERATIAGVALDAPALAVEGGWTWFRDFEVTLAPVAERRALDTEELDVRKSGGVVVKGSHVAIVNLIVHDLPRGIEVMPGAVGTVISGNLVFHSGWKDSPRGTGIHAAAGNQDEYVLDNIVFGQGGAGVSVSMNPGDRVLLEGNVSFDNGVAGEFFDRNILIEGGTMRVARNFTYYRRGRRGGENNFGYAVGCTRIEAEGNYWAHAESYPVNLAKCDGSVTNNTFIGVVDPVFLTKHPGNTHSGPGVKGLQTFVRPNRYDPSRAYIVIYNWDRHEAINLDVTDANLAPGTAYEIRDALNYFGAAVASGTYEGGRLSVPIARLEEAAATGYLPGTLGHTSPEFGVFVLIKTPK
jgi:hypothetical protein